MPFAACFFVSCAALYLVNQILRINSQKPLYRCTGVSADCAVIPGSSVMLIILTFSCSRRVGDVCVSYASTCTLAKRLGTARRRDVRLFLAAFVMFSLKKKKRGSRTEEVLIGRSSNSTAPFADTRRRHPGGAPEAARRCQRARGVCVWGACCNWRPQDTGPHSQVDNAL